MSIIEPETVLESFINPLKPRSEYMYHCFNNLSLCILPTECMYESYDFQSSRNQLIFVMEIYFFHEMRKYAYDTEYVSR
jgi:hypothetical protein